MGLPCLKPERRRGGFRSAYISRNPNQIGRQMAHAGQGTGRKLMEYPYLSTI